MRQGEERNPGEGSSETIVPDNKEHDNGGDGHDNAHRGQHSQVL